MGGAKLADLILEVRREFVHRTPRGHDDELRPNSVRLVALDVFEGKPAGEQALVVVDLLEADSGLALGRDHSDLFRYADTAGDYLADLVCEVVYTVLARDPTIRLEDKRRIELAAAEASDEPTGG